MEIISAALKYSMFTKGDKVLVAVSGGPDSVTLLHALFTNKETLGISSLHIAHINHGIRGIESDLDEKFVIDIADNYKLPITTKKISVPEYMSKYKLGMEEAARKVRHAFLKETAMGIGANKIALGHNSDDRVESVLINIIRGAGINGLGSIRPSRGNICRPLIDSTRKDIIGYTSKNNLKYRIDLSNEDTAYTRNKIRHELLPNLETNYNPNIKQALKRLAHIAESHVDFITNFTSDAYSKIIKNDELDFKGFSTLHPAIKYEVIRLFIEHHLGSLDNISYEQIDRIVRNIDSNDVFNINLPGGLLYITKDNNFVKVKEIQHEIKPISFSHNLIVPGETHINEINKSFFSEYVDNIDSFKAPLSEIFIDGKFFSGSLKFRNILPGDRIIPFGMTGTKKLQDVFTDKKISRKQRNIMIVLTDDYDILWVPNVISSEKTRISKNNSSTIHIKSL